MKKTQFVPMVVYLLMALYFAIYNWDVFSVSLRINLGFFIIKLPLIAIILLSGLIFIVIQWGLTQLINLNYHQKLAQKENEINALRIEYELIAVKKDNEINALKASFYDEQVDQIKRNSESISELQVLLNKIIEVLPVKIDEEKVRKIPAEDEPAKD